MEPISRREAERLREEYEAYLLSFTPAQDDDGNPYVGLFQEAEDEGAGDIWPAPLPFP
jgi:hypothetical protein